MSMNFKNHFHLTVEKHHHYGFKLHSLVLCVAKLPEWVSGSTAIANKDVQIAVMAEQKLPTVVIGRWLNHLQNGSRNKTG